MRSVCSAAARDAVGNALRLRREPVAVNEGVCAALARRGGGERARHHSAPQRASGALPRPPPVTQSNPLYAPQQWADQWGLARVSLTQFLTSLCRAYHDISSKCACSLTCARHAAAFLIEYVSTFVPDASGEHFNPHVSTGLAPRTYLDKLLAEPFEPFTFSPAGAAVYQLGQFGTAAKKLKEFDLKP